MALILEVLDGGGGVARRVPLGSLPLTLGRALDNDVILDDPYVDARHARLVAGPDGGPVLEDLGSVNGVVIARDGGPPGGAVAAPEAAGARAADGAPSPVPVVAGMEARLGRTTLRFRDTEEPVPPALVDDGVWEAADAPWPASGRTRALLIAAALAVSAGLAWLSSYSRSPGTDAMGAVILFLILGSMWAGVWAIAGRVAVQRFEFGGHLAVFGAALMAGSAAVMAEDWAEFLFPASPVPALLGGVLIFTVLAATVALHLGLASSLPVARRWRAASVVCAVVAVLGGAAYLADRDSFTDIPSFPGSIRPVPAFLLPTVDAQEFGEVVDELRVDVDEMVAEGGS